MSRSDDHFDGFAPHTRFKHRVLELYFERWPRKLLLRSGAGSQVVYVDACAGRGIDDEGNHGSPVLAAKIAAMAEGQLGEIRGQRVHVRVIAIEKDEDHFEALAKNLAPFGGKARALHGTLADHIDDIGREFADTPTLFFIDPFGLEPLNGKMVRRALAGPKNEVLVLFADQAALRHFGAAVSQRATRSERQLAKVRSRQEHSLFPELDEPEIAELTPKVAVSKKAQAITRQSAIEILDRAFDGHGWLDGINAVAADQRRDAFVDLYADFLRSCGAERVLAFPVLDADATLRYHLVYATKSANGYVTMKEAIEAALNSGPLPTDVAEIVRYEMGCDVVAVAESIHRRFAGQTVRWTEEPENRRAPCVKNAALEDTPIMPSALEHLKAIFAAYRVPKTRTILFNFPSVVPNYRA